jgi:outer membrane murein-binding lipoprotein Lpp
MKIKEISEARLPDYDYQQGDGEVKVSLASHKSQVYTKMAQKANRIKELKAEIDQLESEFKQESRENVNDLFDATDAVNTRVVETLQFVFTLSKDPKATEAPQYKKIMEELAQHLLPEQIAVLENLKKQYVTVTQKAPALRITPLGESALGGFFAKFKNLVLNWCAKYDQKLAQLKAMSGVA